MSSKTDNQPLKQPSNNPTTEFSTAWSRKTRIPTRYVREIQSGIGTTDGRPRRSDLPPGICISEPILKIEGENKGEGQIEHAMAVDIPKIREELDNLSKAKTWTIIERPKGKELSETNGFLGTKRTQQARWNGTRQDLSPKDSHKYLVSITTTCGPLWQNSDWSN